MSASDVREIAIIAMILIGMAIVAWRGGMRNPVSTGSVDAKLNALSGEVRLLNSSIDGELSSVKTKVGQIEERLDKFEEAVASVADIKRLEKAIDKVAKVLPDIEARQRALSDKLGERAEASAAVAARVEHIDKQVGLIYSVLVTEGMKK